MATAALMIGSMAMKVMQGIAQKKAGNEEAKDIRRQASLQKEETLREADRVKTERRKFLAKQGLSYVHSGVTLEGSPLLVLEETTIESKKEVAALKSQAHSQFRFGVDKGERAKKAGRARMFDAFGQAITPALGAVKATKGIFKQQP